MSFFHRTNRLGLTPEKALWSDRTATQESGSQSQSRTCLNDLVASNEKRSPGWFVHVLGLRYIGVPNFCGRDMRHRLCFADGGKHNR